MDKKTQDFLFSEFQRMNDTLRQISEKMDFMIFDYEKASTAKKIEINEFFNNQISGYL